VTLPTEAAIDEWIGLRPEGRHGRRRQHLGRHAGPQRGERPHESGIRAIGDQLPFLGGRSREQIEALLTTHGLGHVGSDPLLDLVAAQARRMTDEGREPPTRRRYVVWGTSVR
jgi:hypothetical protein